MTVGEFNQLLEKAIKEPLSAGESARLEAYFADNPEAREIWDEEMALNDLLDGAADFTLSSNFTTQVLQAVERENALELEEQEERRTILRRFLGGRWITAGVTAALAIVLTVSLVHQQSQSERTEVAKGVAVVSEAASEASVDVLKDFQLMTNFGQVPEGVDEELLTALEDPE